MRGRPRPARTCGDARQRPPPEPAVQERGRPRGIAHHALGRAWGPGHAPLQPHGRVCLAQGLATALGSVPEDVHGAGLPTRAKPRGEAGRSSGPSSWRGSTTSSRPGVSSGDGQPGSERDHRGARPRRPGLRTRARAERPGSAAPDRQALENRVAGEAAAPEMGWRCFSIRRRGAGRSQRRRSWAVRSQRLGRSTWPWGSPLRGSVGRAPSRRRADGVAHGPVGSPPGATELAERA